MGNTFKVLHFAKTKLTSVGHELESSGGELGNR